MNPSKLALGTAQFGSNYGLTNTSGNMAFGECVGIISRCRDAGIDTIDTAMEYGSSEAILGEIGVSDFNIVSKCSFSRVSSPTSTDAFFDEIIKSLRRLKIPRLHGLLIHDLDAVLSSDFKDKAIEALCRAKAEGVVENIGVSIYEPEILDTVLKTIPIDIVQAPLNAIDLRLVQTGWLDRLIVSGVKVHTRSCFLQGLLLSPPDSLPSYFRSFQPTLEKWQSWLQKTGQSPLQGCLSAVNQYQQISRVVVGVDSLEHLEELLQEAAQPKLFGFKKFIADENLIDPRRWQVS